MVRQVKPELHHFLSFLYKEISRQMKIIGNRVIIAFHNASFSKLITARV